MAKKILDVTCGSRTIWFNKNYTGSFTYYTCKDDRKKAADMWNRRADNG